MKSSEPTNFIIKAADHPIQNVTVFRSSNAQITRTLALDLKAGNNQINIIGLSSSIDTESFRVSGLGDARLLDVMCTVDKKGVIEEEDKDIRDATRKIRDLNLEKSARQGEIDLLLQYGRSLSGAFVSPQQASDFASNFVTKKSAMTKIVCRLNEEIEVLETFVRNSKKPKTGSANGKASIMILAEASGLVQLKISYLVGNALWRPTYDLHAISEDGKPSSFVSLHYRVHLSQSTGEHWNDTSLILSTAATDSLNAGIPEPKSFSIQARHIVMREVDRRRKSYAISPHSHSGSRPRYRTGLSGPKAELEEEDVDDDEEEFLQPILEGVAFVSKSPLSVTYTVDGKSSIPSDGEVHKVSVAQLPFEARISHVTVPRQDVLAHLQCEVQNTTGYHLLPGPVSVFMNDAYVSKTSIPDINTGDMFRCTLGIDTLTRVSHSLTSTSVTSRASSFVEQYKTTTYTSTTTVHNRHDGDYQISVIVKSSVPIAPGDESRIKVFLRKPDGLAESEDGMEVNLKGKDGFKVKWGNGKTEDKGGKKNGKFVWLGSVDPGKEVVLVSEWEVRAPVDVDWDESSS